MKKKQLDFIISNNHEYHQLHGSFWKTTGQCMLAYHSKKNSGTCVCTQLVIFDIITFLDTQLVPTTSGPVTDKPEEMASNADSGFETSSIVSQSSSSQLTKVRH